MIKRILEKLDHKGINVRDLSVALSAMIFLGSMIAFCLVGLISSC